MIKKRTKTTKDDLPELPQELGNYLLLIHELLNEKGYVRGVELAERLDMSRPTVTRAIQRLAALGYANYERYRGITLSKAGIDAANLANQRYQIVFGFLEATGVSLSNIKLESRRLASISSDEVLSSFKAATNKLRK